MTNPSVRLEPSPRAVDWGILGAVSGALATGLLAWTGWDLPAALLVDLHAVLGLSLVVLLGFKFRRVAPRVLHRRRWDRVTPISVALAVVAVSTVAVGVYWSLGGTDWIGAWTALSLHVGLALLTAGLVLVHLQARFRLPTRTDASRRTALQYGALLVAGAVAWRLGEAATAALDVAGAARRDTGSKPIGALADTETDGGAFPVTSWVADDPDPVDREAWTLTVDGRVGESLTLGVGDLDPSATTRATLDCTSGWYTVQEWTGVRVGDLLDSAGVDDDAEWVRFVSVTGYRWSLPLAEAREALLATRVRGSALSHGHGGPARLVAPGRRGFQWVKWVERVEVRRRGDPAQWLVTLVSGLDG